jgi:hypothetical protein
LIRTLLLLFILLSVAGCSGIKPMQPRNNREEGPKAGLFTGPEGAWTIGVAGKPADPPKQQER